MGHPTSRATASPSPEDGPIAGPCPGRDPHQPDPQLARKIGWDLLLGRFPILRGGLLHLRAAGWGGLWQHVEAECLDGAFWHELGKPCQELSLKEAELHGRHVTCYRDVQGAPFYIQGPGQLGQLLPYHTLPNEHRRLSLHGFLKPPSARQGG